MGMNTTTTHHTTVYYSPEPVSELPPYSAPAQCDYCYQPPTHFFTAYNYCGRAYTCDAHSWDNAERRRFTAITRPNGVGFMHDWRGIAVLVRFDSSSPWRAIAGATDNATADMLRVVFDVDGYYDGLPDYAL